MTSRKVDGVKGVRIDPTTHEPMEITSELEHFYTCRSCGQSIDCRDLGQVFHHDGEDHKPLLNN